MNSARPHCFWHIAHLTIAVGRASFRQRLRGACVGIVPATAIAELGLPQPAWSKHIMCNQIPVFPVYIYI